ncbi:MAG: hypothetical protein IPM27_12470 [Nitrosomonadales bacterium]|nr:hypothetical protein [Nitrosomonadales bacterium]
MIFAFAPLVGLLLGIASMRCGGELPFVFGGVLHRDPGHNTAQLLRHRLLAKGEKTFA